MIPAAQKQKQHLTPNSSGSLRKEPELFFTSLHGACQERGDLRSCASAGGIELAVAHAGGDAVLHGPGHRVCVVSVSGDIHKADPARRRRLAHGAPQHRRHLGAVDGGVGVRTVGDALGLGPILGLFVPNAAAV